MINVLIKHLLFLQNNLNTIIFSLIEKEYHLLLKSNFMWQKICIFRFCYKKQQ